MKFLYSPRRRASRQSQCGFTLLEMMIAISLTALIFTGVMVLFDSAARTTIRTQAQIHATNDSANSIQYVVSQMREAQSFALPTSALPNTAEAQDMPGGWSTLSGPSLSLFSTTYDSGSGAETINTAIQMTSPPALTPATNGYKTIIPAITAIQVQNSAGTTIPIPSQPYQSSGGGSTKTVLIYRGDPNGTPDPNPTGSAVTGAGTYLWEYTVPATKLFTLDIADPIPANRNPVALCKSVAKAPNAVQFVRPVYSGVAQPWQVELKIISGYYSPIRGTETIEGSTGVTQLSGKCVYMRDHSATGTPATASTQSSNNAFQFN